MCFLFCFLTLILMYLSSYLGIFDGILTFLLKKTNFHLKGFVWKVIKMYTACKRHIFQLSRARRYYPEKSKDFSGIPIKRFAFIQDEFFFENLIASIGAAQLKNNRAGTQYTYILLSGQSLYCIILKIIKSRESIPFSHK